MDEPVEFEKLPIQAMSGENRPLMVHRHLLVWIASERWVPGLVATNGSH